MPTPHGGSALPIVLMAVIFFLVLAGVAFVNRKHLVKYNDLPTELNVETSDDESVTELAQGAIPYDGFNPDEIYGVKLDPSTEGP